MECPGNVLWSCLLMLQSMWVVDFDVRLHHRIMPCVCMMSSYAVPRMMMMLWWRWWLLLMMLLLWLLLAWKTGWRGRRGRWWWRAR